MRLSNISKGLAIIALMAIPVLSWAETTVPPASELSFKRGVLSTASSKGLEVLLSDGTQTNKLTVVVNASTRLTPKLKDLGTNVSVWPKGLVLNVTGAPKWTDGQLSLLAKTVEVDAGAFFTKVYNGSAERIEPNNRRLAFVTKVGKAYSFRNISTTGLAGNNVRFVRIKLGKEESISLDDIQPGDPIQLVELWKRNADKTTTKVTDLVVRVTPRSDGKVVRVMEFKSDYTSTLIRTPNRLVITNTTEKPIYLYTKEDQRKRFVPMAPINAYLGQVLAKATSREFKLTEGDKVMIYVYDSLDIKGKMPLAEFSVEVKSVN